MKRIVFIVSFFVSLFNLPALKANTVAASVNTFESAELVITFHISGEIGRIDKDCKKLGLSCLNIEFDWTFNEMPVKGSTPLTFAMPASNVMKIVFPIPTTDPVLDEPFVVDKDVTVAQKLCKSFGYSQIIILKGEYKCVKEKAGYASVVVNVKSGK